MTRVIVWLLCLAFCLVFWATVASVLVLYVPW